MAALAAGFAGEPRLENGAMLAASHKGQGRRKGVPYASKRLAAEILQVGRKGSSACGDGGRILGCEGI